MQLRSVGYKLAIVSVSKCINSLIDLFMKGRRKMAKTIKKATQTKAPAKNTSVETAMKAVAAKKPEVKAAAPAPVKKTEEKPAAKAEVKPAVKETVKKAEEKVAEKKTRKPRKKTVKKPVEKIQEVFVEFNGEQFKTASIIEKIHEVYKAEGHRVGAIKSLRVYSR